MKKYNVAILGATGAVGQEFLKLIEERDFPFAELRLLASSRSAGTEIPFMGKKYIVEEATSESFKDIDIALFYWNEGRFPRPRVSQITPPPSSTRRSPADRRSGRPGDRHPRARPHLPPALL